MSKRISVQWRITILTALLIAAACVSLNLLLFYSGSGSMDALNGFVVEYKTENQQEMTIQIPKENMQAFFSDFSQQVNEEKVRFERIGWYITALVTLLSAIIAYFFSGKALKPLKDFAQQTEQINEESLTDTRLPEDTTAEFRQLSRSTPCSTVWRSHLTRSGSSPAMRRTSFARRWRSYRHGSSFLRRSIRRWMPKQPRCCALSRNSSSG